MDAVEEKDGKVCLLVRIQPKASREEVRCEPDGRIRIALTAPPVEGKANKALKTFLSKRLKVPKRAIEIVGGEKSREKRLIIEGTSRTAVWKSLKNS
ncbi:MAG: DUF167 domain-containing protein [Candidatus Hydrogenedentota bacterium]